MQAHNICAYISIYVHTHMYVAYMHSKKYTIVWEKFTAGYFHVKMFMLKYFHRLG